MAPGGAPGTTYEAGDTGNTVDEAWDTMSFQGTYAAVPAVVSCMQTYSGADTCGVRCRNPGTTSIEVFIEEEKSSDDEVGHADESVGYAAFAAGPICGSALSNDNDGDGIPDDLDPDDDNDGMPDLWEEANGPDPLLPNADDDPDGDGLSNIEEYIAHTDPRSPESVFQIGNVNRVPGGFEIRFDTATGRLYAVQYESTMLSLGLWNRLGGEIAGTGGEVTVVDTNAAACRFYRIRVRLE